ncbi:hypothetical protein AXG93_3548s1010 [Marchantia polymorpha subsp. ruderalis]|uniref:Uncharacterized protein n=1 Tax=Marchantia polymorpha subsp. ruderalis TaxID=1480154 RepID=A0A176VEH5_MARPO|nr:hypothetical protein AXG93_3548s1010 [Marchantia polymorpha subsp. ruderalis]
MATTENYLHDILARVPSEEARRPSGHKGRHAATAGMPARKRWLPSEQVPFDDSPSGLRLKRTKRKKRSKEEPSAKTSLAQKPLEQIVVGKSRDGETRGPSAEAPSAVAVREGVAGPPGAGSLIPLEVLARHRVEAAAEEAARPCARELPRISAATKILEIKDDTPSAEEEVQSVRGTPTRVLCEQVVPILWYLDYKATKYGVSKAQRKIKELRARVQTEISSEQAQNRILAGERVRQTRALEQSEAARRADEE